MKPLEQLEQRIAQIWRDNEPVNLYKPMSYAMGNAGKMIRPQLLFSSHQLFQEKTSSEAIDLAACVEVFHNFTLLHDDVMDEAPLRRGEPTVHNRFGVPSAILTGDMMVFEVMTILEAFPAQIRRRFNEMALDVCRGQQMDMDFEVVDTVSYKEYLEMIRLKTAVLIAYCAWSGGVLNNQSEEICSKLWQIGEGIGVAFQLQDDYLDAFGGSDKTGKKVGGDISQHKKTALHILLQERCTEVERSLVDQEDGRDAPAFIEQILDLYRKYNVDRDIRNAVVERSTACLTWLNEFEVRSEGASLFKSLCDKLSARAF